LPIHDHETMRGPGAKMVLVVSGAKRKRFAVTGTDGDRRTDGWIHENSMDEPLVSKGHPSRRKSGR